VYETSETDQRKTSSTACPRHHRAFELIYRKHVGFVSRVIQRFGVPRDEVEDTTQEVFLILHRRFDELGDPIRARPWLYAVAQHVCQNRLRAWRRSGLRWGSYRAWVEAQKTIDTAPDEIVSSGEVREILTQGLANLDSNKRAVFLMSELGGHTAKEIAEAIGASPNTVASRLRAARHELARYLAQRARS